ncbi:thiamine pyrophosphate-dependent dehydrogenase E1 component subunit alpha [Caenimonas sp. SL110]|uniref:thiamine pyrophosphate-dependent dehydrogenase E1 component subunit alpha n=1 Tax=Caenimonas sp. SL110 TaxID=1450524 RepID=UPI0006537380|nr:thiamine pyrophosphate-dependent dehydrogenase E1 component subunit alpha [Caenimonas sp. SL110]
MAKPKPDSARLDTASPMSLIDLYERMLLVRECELRLAERFNDGKIPGFIHLSIGQEGIAAGVAGALRTSDTIASTHRGHGHGIAKGMAPEALFHEISGNLEGPCRGRGGSLHVADFSVGMLGANGIVGGGIPIAVGSALAHARLGNGNVSAVFFGDGALAEGVLYESMNLAALKRLPVMFVCENNGWSEFSPSSSQYVGTFEKLAATFNIPYLQVDGNDVEAVHDASIRQVARMRAGEGPAALECLTLRVKGHYEGDPQVYRKGVTDPRASVDPIAVARQRLEKAGTPIAQVDARVKAQVNAAAAAAAAGTRPVFEEALQGVYA